MKNCKKCNSEFEPKKGLINYCSLICRNSRNWSEEDKIKKSESAKKSIKIIEANKKIGQKIRERTKYIIKNCGVCNSEMVLPPSGINRKYCSNECYKLSDSVKKCGGYRIGSGIGKKGWYKGYWCDSSWELAWVIYHIDKEILFERNYKKFSYYFNDKKHYYIPDFIINDVFYEIKGYVTKQTEEKINQFEKQLKVLYKEDIEVYLNYVINKYGKNFISLYENNPYNDKTNTCLICGNLCSKKNKVCSRKCSGILVSSNKKLMSHSPMR